MDELRPRLATAADASAIASIYNEGIAARSATFETEPRSVDEVARWVAASVHPMLVAEVRGEVVAAGWISAYSERLCYGGVGECSVYVAADHRGRGIGTALCEALAAEAERQGFYKLLGKLFTTNEASNRLVRRCGFREVGVHLCHGRLGGGWRDVLLVERLLGDAARVAARSPG
ncbi:MAG: N-acetyltransferase [Actinobacteria bacterium]|nr:N-acetyltransferase [Actinomycetota bacterium]